jgi:dolichyl-phosphate-mannose--protein O-mannosyl transferase
LNKQKGFPSTYIPYILELIRHKSKSITFIVLTLLALISRFHNISEPSEVVFDEVIYIYVYIHLLYERNYIFFNVFNRFLC